MATTYGEMVREVRSELKKLHEQWIFCLRRKPGAPFTGNIPKGGFAVAITATHNFLLEIRGKEYRHGTEKRFFQCHSNRYYHDGHLKLFREKYAEILRPKEVAGTAS